MRVVVGLLTENTSRMLVQATRLVRSIRWFGGELASARILVCGVGELEPRARKILEDLGAEIRIVSRFHPANPAANRLQLIDELLDAPEELLLVLDCDTLVVQDPLPHLRNDLFQAKITPAPTVTDEVFERLFAHFKLAKPPLSQVTPFTGTPTIPYFNSGVIAMPPAIARVLVPSWKKFNRALADDPQLAAPCERHMHQAALALALAETSVPRGELPEAMNYQLNTTHLTPPPGFVETDPVMLHYHQLATEDGFLLPTPYARAQARIEQFHERLREKGFVQEERPAAVDDSRPIVVLGMHRSGTSLVTQLIAAMGSYAGEPDALIPPDIFNPTGYWEHAATVMLDREIMDALSASWTDVAGADVSRLSPERRAGYVARAKAIAQSLRVRESFVLKDPRMALLFPLWREALGNSFCVIVWRDPFAVARSLATRDRRPALISIAAWEHYNRTLLRDTEGLPRLLVSYEELLADPMRVIRELQTCLGLTMPADDVVQQIVKPDFNRSGSEAADGDLLDSNQRELLEALRSGAVLREPVPPTSPRTVALLAAFAEVEKREKPLRERIAELDLLLSAVFESKSWRVTGLLRRKGVSAAERWRELRKKPL